MEVTEPGALPLRASEQVRLEARLNQPAYSYLLWIDGQGHVSLVYPRQDDKFGGSPSDGSAQETVERPEALDQGLKMKGPGGLETVLLWSVVLRYPRTSTWRPRSDRCPRHRCETSSRSRSAGDEGQPTAALRVDMHRGIDEDQTDKIDDPLLQLMETLRTQNQFEVIKAVRFAYRGE